MIFLGILFAPAAFLAGASPTSDPATATPATAAATDLLEIRVQNRVSRVQFLQDGRELPIERGTVRLKAAPFAVRVRGNLSLGVVASERDTLAQTLAKGRHAFVYVIANNYPYVEGDLYLNEKADVTPWREFVFTDRGAEKILRDHLIGELPVVLNCGSQWPCAFAEEGSDEYTFPVRRLMALNGVLADKESADPVALEWGKVKAATVVLMATAPMDGKVFEYAGTASVRLVFDR